MKQKEAELLADKIATDILTMHIGKGNNTECTRAQLMLKQKDGAELNMGGRNKDCLKDVILEHLRKI